MFAYTTFTTYPTDITSAGISHLYTSVRRVIYPAVLAVLIILATLVVAPLNAHSAEKTAVFAGGCFWCMEEAYEKIPGVTKVISGYSGGKTKSPTYQQVTGGNTGHYEAVRVYYDDTQVSYKELLDVFWVNIDPFDDGGQFCDRGASYKSAIFYQNDEELKLATRSLKDLRAQIQKSTNVETKGRIVTPILAFKRFYDGESYHQDYYKRNSVRYNYYKYGCGRPARLEKLWG